MIFIISVLAVFNWVIYNDYNKYNMSFNRESLQHAVYLRVCEIARGEF